MDTIDAHKLDNNGCICTNILTYTYIWPKLHADIHAFKNLKYSKKSALLFC